MAAEHHEAQDAPSGAHRVNKPSPLLDCLLFFSFFKKCIVF